MSDLIYLGDEATAAGFRLAGIDARVAEAGDERAALERACAEAAVVLLGGRCAAALPRALLAAACRAAQPQVLVLDDGEGRSGDDAAEPVRRLLGATR